MDYARDKFNAVYKAAANEARRWDRSTGEEVLPAKSAACLTWLSGLEALHERVERLIQLVAAQILGDDDPIGIDQEIHRDGVDPIDACTG